MSLENVPGFLPILNTLLQPLPQFLVSYIFTSSPILILSLATLMSYNDFFQASNNRPSLILGVRDPPETYDFIIVGGGTSGAVLASRLSANYRVLLLEAGSDPSPVSYVPAFGPSLYNKPQVDWEYRSLPLNGSGYGTTSSGGCLKYPRSRSLGGSTNVNDMIYMRGNPNDYDLWAVKSGDLRWSYEYVRKYFQKIEDYHGHWESDEGSDHTTGGPIHIEKAGFTAGVQSWLDAGYEMGFKSNRDPNDQLQSDNLFQLDVMAKRGIRHSTYRGYLENILRKNRWSRRRQNRRPKGDNNNLVVQRYSVVTHIDIEEFENGTKRAVGVTYFRHAIKQYARADKEIILAAGAINTPKLLLLSGVGPKEELESVAIEQKVELPVGKNNLQDHVSTIVGPFILNNSSESFLPSRDLNVKTAAEYLSHGVGAFSMPTLISGGGLMSTTTALPNWPNILYTLLGSGTDHMLEKILVETYGINHAQLSSFLRNYTNKDSSYVVVTLGRPKSRGSVRIGSFDAWHHPHIDLNYFSDELGQDMKDMIEGVQMAVNLFENTNSYQKVGAHLVSDQYPGCEKHEMKSEAYWECLIRTVTVSLGNPCCTAPMGMRGSPDAVVDSELRVIGVDGLRIADASVMPDITNAQIAAPTIMIGEVASDLIINEWTKQSHG